MVLVLGCVFVLRQRATAVNVEPDLTALTIRQHLVVPPHFLV